jgi:hypothetical protein
LPPTAPPVKTVVTFVKERLTFLREDSRKEDKEEQIKRNGCNKENKNRNKTRKAR